MWLQFSTILKFLGGFFFWGGGRNQNSSQFLLSVSQNGNMLKQPPNHKFCHWVTDHIFHTLQILLSAATTYFWSWKSIWMVNVQISRVKLATHQWYWEQYPFFFSVMDFINILADIFYWNRSKTFQSFLALQVLFFKFRFCKMILHCKEYFKNYL